MKKERSNHGFGLAVFGILLLVIAFLAIISFKNALVASIVAFLAAIMAGAGWFEARRADGPKAFALTILILSVLGIFIILMWSGTISKFTGRENGTIIANPPEEVRPPTPPDETKKLDEMEKVIEGLEKDTSGLPPDSLPN